MIATRKRLCLIYLGPLLCLIGIIYTVFYTEYKLPRMIKRMQNNLATNKNLYSPYQGDEDVRLFSIFPAHKPDDKEEIKDENDTEENLESEATHNFEECQIWIPIKDNSLIQKKVHPNITDKTFFQVCSIESAIKSSRSDEETKNKICLLVDRYDTSLLNDKDSNQTQSLPANIGLHYFQNIRKEKWFQALKKKYNTEGNQLSLIIPDYAIVFSGITLGYREDYSAIS